jgi:hypothetical protein
MENPNRNSHTNTKPLSLGYDYFKDNYDNEMKEYTRGTFLAYFASKIFNCRRCHEAFFLKTSPFSFSVFLTWYKQACTGFSVVTTKNID